MKDKYGSDFEEEEASNESTDSESAESEDEDGEELTPTVDAAILRTLARIKRKDPSIYEIGKDIYEGVCVCGSPHIGCRLYDRRASRGTTKSDERGAKEEGKG